MIRSRRQFVLARAICLCAFVMCGLSSVSAAVEFDQLLSRIPRDANAIVALDVESVFASPLALSEGWQQRYADESAATPLILPPQATRLLLAARMDTETIEPAWEVASMGLSVPQSVEDIQAITGGVVDTLSGLPTLWPKNDTCVAVFSDTEFGIISPTNRQTAGQWIQRSKSQPVNAISSYLRKAKTMSDRYKMKF